MIQLGGPPTTPDSCPVCGDHCQWLRHKTYGWCRRCEVLLVKDPTVHTANLPQCEWGHRAGMCTNDGEFIVDNGYANQIACRAHIGALADGPWQVYGLSDRAITAVKKWQTERSVNAD